jgi:hypothetical protein
VWSFFAPSSPSCLYAEVDNRLLSAPNMCEADSILAGERSRNRPDRMVNAFAPGYVIAESAETDNTMCIMTFTNAPGELD